MCASTNIQNSSAVTPLLTHDHCSGTWGCYNNIICEIHILGQCQCPGRHCNLHGCDTMHEISTTWATAAVYSATLATYNMWPHLLWSCHVLHSHNMRAIGCGCTSLAMAGCGRQAHRCASTSVTADYYRQHHAWPIARLACAADVHARLVVAGLAQEASMLFHTNSALPRQCLRHCKDSQVAYCYCVCLRDVEPCKAY